MAYFSKVVMYLALAVAEFSAPAACVLQPSGWRVVCARPLWGLPAPAACECVVVVVPGVSRYLRVFDGKKCNPGVALVRGGAGDEVVEADALRRFGGENLDFRRMLLVLTD